MKFSFYIFSSIPNDVDTKNKWFLALANIKCTQGAFICEKHFEEACFISTKTTKRLKKESIPTIFDNIGNIMISFW